MKSPVQFDRRATAVLIVMAAAALAIVLARSGAGQAVSARAKQAPAPSTNAAPGDATVDLSPGQLNEIKVGAVGSHLFPVEKEAVGCIAFDDDLSVQVYPQYPGKLLKTFVELGDKVKKGRPLYTIDSPDLIQAESTLIGAAATLQLTTRELARVKALSGTNGISEREVEQAMSEEQSAEGALKAAQDAVRVFGKTEAEINDIVAKRKVDPEMVVCSPVSGQVIAYNAPPGLLVQPGAAPAPFSVADTSTKWMLASVTESDSPFFHEGQPVEAKVMAYPDRSFKGKISKIYATVDPYTHRVTIRSEIADSGNELRPGMLASFVIQVRDPVEAAAIPMNGVVRNGDGTMAAWVTTDRRHFSQKIIRVGLQDDGLYQLVAGLRPGELAVTDGAIFLNNMLEAPPTD